MRAWVKLHEKGSIRRGRRADGRSARLSRLGPVDRKWPARSAPHPQWDQNAIKVATEAELKVGQWNHVLVTYDGSGKAAGLKVYVNGERQESKC